MKRFILSLFFSSNLIALSVDFVPVAGYTNEWSWLREALVAKGHTIKAVKPEMLGKGDVLVANNPNLNYEKIKSYKKTILIIWEPPVVQPEIHEPKLWNNFDRIITWDDRYVDNRRFIKIYCPCLNPMLSLLPSYHERNLACLMNGNKTSSHPQELYSTRLNIINFYEKRNDPSFDLYGGGWESKSLRCFKGSPANKIQTLSHYRFNYALENYDNNCGYITEKIFDAFAAGTIPIYLGAKNIRDYIPENCFIDMRKFKNLESLHQFLITMDEETFLNYQENIRQFLTTEKAKKFSNKAFLDNVLNTIFN